MSVYQSEPNASLDKDEIDELLNEMTYMQITDSTSLNRKKIQDLFSKLGPLLKSGDPHCLNLIDDLRIIPGTGELIKEMEDSYFGEAVITFDELKEDYIKRSS